MVGLFQLNMVEILRISILDSFLSYIYSYMINSHQPGLEKRIDKINKLLIQFLIVLHGSIIDLDISGQCDQHDSNVVGRATSKCRVDQVAHHFPRVWCNLKRLYQNEKNLDHIVM